MIKGKREHSGNAPHMLEILRKKRNGVELSRAEIEHLVHGQFHHHPLAAGETGWNRATRDSR
jgi:hypothetical protein